MEVSNIVLIEKTTLKPNVGVLWGTKALVWEASDKYGVDYDFLNYVFNCECNFNKPNEECLGDRGLAYGRAQFHKPTFKMYCGGDYYSEQDQIFCATRLFLEGKGYLWSCAKKFQTLADKI
uniref:Transglycosylase n=1 Tax=viral metagenome TaxID=1070528 RepID=A0A6M3Y432_9ZZZZ